MVLGYEIKRAQVSYCLYFNFNYNEGRFIVHLFYMVNKNTNPLFLQTQLSVYGLNSQSLVVL